MDVRFYSYNNTTQEIIILGVVDNYTSFSFTRSYSGIGEWSMSINGNAEVVDRLRQAKFIAGEDGVAGIITNYKETMDDNGIECVFSGKELKAIASQRIVMPPGTLAYWKYVKMSPEYIMAELLYTQMVNVENPNRYIDCVIDPFDESSTLINFDARYDPLDECIESIAETYNIGWYAYIGIDDVKIHWKIYHGVNRSENQYDNNKFILSYGRDTLKSSTLTRDVFLPNMGVVGGQGEGTERAIALVEDDITALNRIEKFIDARDIESSADLPQRGEEKLASYGDEDVYEITLAPLMAQHYRVDFDLGDIGTIHTASITADNMLTEITEVYEGGNLIQIDTTFGYDKEKLLYAIKRIISNANTTVKDELSASSLNIDCYWSVKLVDDYIYSTPQVATLSTGRKVIAIMRYDSYGVLMDYETGDVIWTYYLMGHESYGAPVIGDLNGDGKQEIVFATHEGLIACVDEEGNKLWEQWDEYNRNGNYVIQSSIYHTDTNTSTLTIKNGGLTLNLGIRSYNNTDYNASLGITHAGQEIKYTIVSYPNDYQIEVKGQPSITNGDKAQIYCRYTSDHIFQHAGTIKDGYLYITGMDQCCRKINGKTGEIVWVYSTLEAIEPQPIVLDIDKDGVDECVFVSVDYRVYCANAITGEIKWYYDCQGACDAFLTSYYLEEEDKTLIIEPCRDGSVYVLNPDGTLYSRTLQQQHDIDCGVAILDDGSYVVGGDAGQAWRFTIDGEPVWRDTIGMYINATPRSFHLGGREYSMVSAMDGCIYFYKTSTGSRVDVLLCKGSVEGTPWVEQIDENTVEIIETNLRGYVERYRITPKN